MARLIAQARVGTIFIKMAHAKSFHAHTSFDMFWIAEITQNGMQTWLENHPQSMPKTTSQNLCFRRGLMT